MGSFSTNVVVLGGYLAAEPEARDLPKGDLLTKFRLAVNNSEETVYVSVATFGRLAETCAEFLGKGSPVVVEGRLHQNKWETQEGEKRSSLSVDAYRVNFLPKQNGSQEEKR